MDKEKEKEKELNEKRGGRGGRGGRGRGRGRGGNKSLLKPKPQFKNLMREVDPDPVNEMTADEMATELLQLPCMTPGWVNSLPSIDVNPSYVSIVQHDESWPTDTILTSSGVQTSSSAASLTLAPTDQADGTSHEFQ